MNRPLSRAEKEELLAALEERARRTERRRIEEHRAEVLANCTTLHGFIREFWRVLEPVAEFKSGWALQAMCAHLEAVTDGRIKRLLMTVPPGMMKSLLLVFWTAWEWGPKGLPHLSALATSYSQANVHRDNMKLRDLVKSEKFQTLWPLGIRSDQDAKGKFANERSGFSEARPFSKMTGGRANRVKIDDPHDTESAESEVERPKAVRIMREAISDRVNDPVEDAIVLIMQRLHDDDCAAAAMALGYTHLNLPMEFEASQRCRTLIGFVDPRKVEGELLFPERFPRAEVEGLKKAKGAYAYSGQYQQRPVPREGAYFSADWFNRYRDRPANLRIYGTSDYAVKADSGDFTVHRIWGVASSGDIYMLGGWRGQATSDVWIERKLDLIRDWKPVAWFGEGGVIRHAIEPMLIRRSRERKVWCKFEWLNSIHDKATRARGFQARAAMGAIFVPDDDLGEAWIAELCAFPAGAHDDEVDAASILGRALDDAHPATAMPDGPNKPKADAWDNDDEEGSADAWKAA